MPPRTASTLLLLYRRGPQRVTDIADRLRQSHPLAIQWIGALATLDMVTTAKDTGDRRRTIVALTPAGEVEARRMLAARASFDRALRALCEEADADVLAPLWRLERALQRQSFADRLNTAPPPEL